MVVKLEGALFRWDQRDRVAQLLSADQRTHERETAIVSLIAVWRRGPIERFDLQVRQIDDRFFQIIHGQYSSASRRCTQPAQSHLEVAGPQIGLTATDSPVSERLESRLTRRA